MKRTTSGLISLAMAGSGLVAVAAPSYAVCAPENPIYNVSNVVRIDKPTGLVSNAIQGPGSVSYDDQATASSTWGGSTSVSGDIGAFIFELESKVEINHSKTWSKSQTWRYTLAIAAGKTQRIRMFHRASRFTVTKKIYNTGRANTRRRTRIRSTCRTRATRTTCGSARTPDPLAAHTTRAEDD